MYLSFVFVVVIDYHTLALSRFFLIRSRTDLMPLEEILVHLIGCVVPAPLPMFGPNGVGDIVWCLDGV